MDFGESQKALFQAKNQKMSTEGGLDTQKVGI